MPGFAPSLSALLRIALVAAFGMAGAAGATELPSLVVPNAGPAGMQDASDTRVLPVWNNESGRIEALLLLDTPDADLNPLDRLLGSGAPAPGLGARLSFADGSRVSTAHPGGSLTELLTVYAIVNAVTANLPAIQRVQLLVDGQEVDTIAGHVDVRRPLTRDTSLVRDTAP